MGRTTAQIIMDGVDFGVHLFAPRGDGSAPGPAPAAAPAPAPAPAPALHTLLPMVLAVAVMLALQPMLRLPELNQLLRDIAGPHPHPFQAPPAGHPMDFTDSHLKIDLTTRSGLGEGQSPCTFELSARVTQELRTARRDTNLAQESTATEPTPGPSRASASSEEDHQNSQNSPSINRHVYYTLSTVLNYIRTILNNYVMRDSADQQQLLSGMRDALNATQSQSSRHASASTPSTSRPTDPHVHHSTCHQQAQRMATYSSSSSDHAPCVSNNRTSQEPRPSVSLIHSRSTQNPPYPSTSTGFIGQQERPNYSNQKRILKPKTNIPGSGTSTSRQEQAPDSLAENLQGQPVYSDDETPGPSQRGHPYQPRRAITRSFFMVCARRRPREPSSGHASATTTSANPAQGSSRSQRQFQIRSCPQFSTMQYKGSVFRVVDCRLPGSSQNQQQQAEVESDTEEDSNIHNTSTQCHRRESSRSEASIDQQEISNRPQDLRTVIRDEHGWNSPEFVSSSQRTSGHRARSFETPESPSTSQCRSQQPPSARHSSALLPPTRHQEVAETPYSQYAQYSQTHPYQSTENSHRTVMRGIPDPYQHYYGFNTRVSGNNPYHPTKHTQPPREMQTSVQETRGLEHNIAEQFVDGTIETRENPGRSPNLPVTFYETATGMESRQLSANTQPFRGYTGQPSTTAIALQSFTDATYPNTGSTTNTPHFSTPAAYTHGRNGSVTATQSAVESINELSGQTPLRIGTTVQTTTQPAHWHVRQPTTRMAAATQSDVQTTNVHPDRGNRSAPNASHSSLLSTYWRPSHVNIPSSNLLSNMPSAHGHTNQTPMHAATAHQSTLELAQISTDHLSSMTAHTLHSILPSAGGHLRQTPRGRFVSPQLPMVFAHLPSDATASITATQRHSIVPLSHVHPSQAPGRTGHSTAHQSTEELAQMPTDHIASMTSPIHSVLPSVSGHLSQTPTGANSAPHSAMSFVHVPTTASITNRHSTVPLAQVHPSQRRRRKSAAHQSTVALAQVPTDAHIASMTASSLRSNVQTTQGHSSQPPIRTVTGSQSPAALILAPTYQTACTTASERRSNVTAASGHPNQMPCTTITSSQSTNLAKTPRSSLQSPNGHSSQKRNKTTSASESSMALVNVFRDQTTGITTGDLQSTNSSTLGQTEQGSNRTASTSQSTSSYGYPNLETSSTAAGAESITTGVAPKRAEGKGTPHHHQVQAKQFPQCGLAVESGQEPTNRSDVPLFSTEHVARILCEVQAVSAARARSRDQNQLPIGQCEQQTEGPENGGDLGNVNDHGVEEGELRPGNVGREEDSLRSSAPGDERVQQLRATGEDEIERQADACESDENPQQIDARGIGEDDLQSDAHTREYDARLPRARREGEGELQRDVIGKRQKVTRTCVRGRDASDVEQSSDGSVAALHPMRHGQRRRASSTSPDEPPTQRPRLDHLRTSRTPVAANHAPRREAKGSSSQQMLEAVPPKLTPDTLAMWHTFNTKTQERAQPEGGSLNMEALVQALEQEQPSALPTDLHSAVGLSHTQAPDSVSIPGSSHLQAPDHVCAPGTSHAPVCVHVTVSGTSHPQVPGHEHAPASPLAEASGRLTARGSSQVHAPGQLSPPGTSHAQDNDKVDEVVVAKSVTDDSSPSRGVSSEGSLAIDIPPVLSPLAASPAVADRDDDDLPVMSPGSVTSDAVSCSTPLRGTISSFEPPCTSVTEFLEIEIKEEPVDVEPDTPDSWPVNRNCSQLAANFSDSSSTETLAQNIKPDSSPCPENICQIMKGTNSSMASTSGVDCTHSTANSDTKIKERDGDDKAVPGPSSGKKRKNSKRSTSVKVNTEDEKDDRDTDGNEDFKQNVPEEKKKSKMKKGEKPKNRIQWIKNLKKLEKKKK